MRKKYFANPAAAAIFTAVIIVLSFVRIPAGAIPITLGTFSIYLAGGLQKPLWAFVSSLLYVVIGAIGIPVFTSGGGIAALVGPTGGYLAGYIAAAAAIALICKLGKSDKKSVVQITLAVLAGVLLIYLLGNLWMCHLSKTGFIETLSVSLIPFIPGEILKIPVAVYLIYTFRKTDVFKRILK